MDPVRGNGSLPVTVAPSGQGAVEATGSDRPDTLSVAPQGGLYGSQGSQPAARGGWPPLRESVSNDFGEDTVDRCSSELAKLEAELDKLGTGSEDMAKAMKIQRKLDMCMRIMTLISEIWKSRSDAIRSCIANIA